MSHLLHRWRQVRSRTSKAWHAFTLIEVLMTLGVGAMLLVAVTMFLVSGNVATKKVTNLNAVNVKGRFSFDHISKEMSLSGDLNAANFQAPNSDSTAFSRITYRVNLGLPGTTSYTLHTADEIVVDLPIDTKPQVGDYLVLGTPRLNDGAGGRIIAVSDTRGAVTHGDVTLTLEDTIEALSGR
ncbi:MAG TPA: prepilin-type N-terminal cleavage/methylation domain-containing protein, partial [Opitutaceae bacterium]|nr:prepilin-type N-terminal cleavage/methylation domain-containing protein [Opitutaceae bacterium]